ncbi:MAG: hypothetical protein M3379_21760, partial [Acidobacteriota bacterium]|nr:hypothetical protein [Acidobacteriota bacterium]
MAGVNLIGATFSVQPALVPPGIVVNSSSISPDGASATLAVRVNANAVGTFVIIASNAAGNSDAFASAANSITVLD